MIERAIFVLTNREAGEQLLGILPDLLDLGLDHLTLLHLLPARRGPVEPMPELATWVRHFEAAVPEVDLALKRGDPIRWISELSRTRRIQLVVLPGDRDETWIENLERVTSPLRALGVPVLFLPRGIRPSGLLERVCIAVKHPPELDRLAREIRAALGPVPLTALHVPAEEPEPGEPPAVDVGLHTVATDNGVASALLQETSRRKASLLILTAGDPDPAAGGRPVVRPLVAGTDGPVLIWPDAVDPAAD